MLQGYTIDRKFNADIIVSGRFLELACGFQEN
jgi:hypothetical protein